MIWHDVATVLAIAAADPETAKWTDAALHAALRRRNCIGLVAECGEEVVGFAVYELSDGWVDVTALAVAPARRRRGVGARLMVKLVGKLRSHRRRTLRVVVSEANLAAHLFLRHCGAKAVAVVPTDDGADGYEFHYEADDPPPPDLGGGG
jgi:ribosomal-protein-alanine N-acetyltransferase